MTLTGSEPISVKLWRDYDEVTRTLPGMSLGAADRCPAARDLFDRGVRRVDLDRVVDAGGGADPATAVRSLVLVRDLTSYGIVVDWQLRLPEPDRWRMLSHLWPPTLVAGQAAGKEKETEAEWRRSHYLGKCLYRFGPGFIQVRDRRQGELRRFTIDEPEYHAAIELLADGVRAADIDPDILAALTEEDLVAHIGDLAWWLPYRVHRWPSPALIV